MGLNRAAETSNNNSIRENLHYEGIQRLTELKKKKKRKNLSMNLNKFLDLDLSILKIIKKLTENL